MNFCMNKYNNCFETRKANKMDEFERKEKIGCEGKIIFKIYMMINKRPCLWFRALHTIKHNGTMYVSPLLLTKQQARRK